MIVAKVHYEKMLQVLMIKNYLLVHINGSGT